MMQGKEKLSTKPGKKINYLEKYTSNLNNYKLMTIGYLLITVSSSLGDATICKFKFRTPRLEGFVIKKLSQSQRPKIFLLVKLPYLWLKLPYLWKTVHSYWKIDFIFQIAMAAYQRVPIPYSWWTWFATLPYFEKTVPNIFLPVVKNRDEYHGRIPKKSP